MGGLFAVLMGMTLSLIGAGGSIMTVPILVYIIGLPATIATSYSLFIVGSTALVGAISYWRRGEIFIGKSLLFAGPALISVWYTRTIFLPSMPKLFLNVSLDHWIMLFFAFLIGTGVLLQNLTSLGDKGSLLANKGIKQNFQVQFSRCKYPP